MNALNVFIPHVLFILGAFFCFIFLMFFLYIVAGILSILIFHKSTKSGMAEPWKIAGLYKDQMTNLFFILNTTIMLLGYTSIFLYPTDWWIRAKPTASWEKKIGKVDTAIILGFGYEKEENGEIQPGKANEFLYKWTIENTKAKTVLVQEGVWVAACKTSDRSCKKAGRSLIRIHLHDDKIDMNTIETAFCALQKMEQLGKNKAILIAHDLQLQRAAWDFEKLKKARIEWQNYVFVVPQIPDTPFPENSRQLRTGCSMLYKMVELFLSRPRDFFSPLPEKCKAPVPLTL